MPYYVRDRRQWTKSSQRRRKSSLMLPNRAHGATFALNQGYFSTPMLVIRWRNNNGEAKVGRSRRRKHSTLARPSLAIKFGMMLEICLMGRVLPTVDTVDSHPTEISRFLHAKTIFHQDIIRTAYA